MSFYCALSGEPTHNPVIVPQTGYVYEKTLLEKYFAENGDKDPITGAKVEGGLDACVVVKRPPSNLKISAPNPEPRPPSLSSVPSLLHLFQTEWDNVMLECAELRKVANQLRQDLSLALYKEDAAMRVLARIVRERDEARDALNNITSTLGVPTKVANGGGNGDVEMEDAEERQVPAEVEARVDETHQSLTTTRRKLKPPSAKFAEAIHVQPVTADEIKRFEQVQLVGSLHGAKANEAGISAVATWGAGGLSRADESKDDAGIVATGGNDKSVQVYDRTNDKVLATLKGHTKPVTSIVLSPLAKTSGDSSIPTFVASASLDKTVRLWAPTGTASAKSAYKSWTSISGHEGGVNGLSLHPSNTLLASAAADGTWGLYDISNSDVNKLILNSSAPKDVGYTSIEFHPDGALLGVGGSDGAVRIWDPRKAALSASFESSGSVTSLGFSENGFLLAVGYGDEKVKIWDLRKTTVTHEFETGTGEIKNVGWDPSAGWLTVTGEKGVGVWANKSWETVKVWEVEGGVSGGAWNRAGREIVTAGKDRSLRAFGVKA